MRWLTGHRGDVRAVAYAPDGRLVSGGSDKTVRVWDVPSGTCRTTIRVKAPVFAVAVSPDGAVIAYAGRYAPRAESNFVSLCDPAGRTIRRHELRTEGYVWQRDAATGEFNRVTRPVPRSIWSLAFSADGWYLAAACRVLGGSNRPDGGGGWWWGGSAGGAPHGNLSDRAFAVTFAPVGQRLAYTEYRLVNFLESPGTQEGVSYPLTAEWSSAVAFVPGAELAAVAANSFVYFVNPVRHEEPIRLKTTARVVSALAVSPDGRLVLAGGRPGGVEVYDAATRARLTTYDFGLGGLHALAFAPDGLTFAAAGDKGLVVADAPG